MDNSRIYTYVGLATELRPVFVLIRKLKLPVIITRDPGSVHFEYNGSDGNAPEYLYKIIDGLIYLYKDKWTETDTKKCGPPRKD